VGVSVDWDNGATSWELGVGVVVADGEVGDAVLRSVLRDAFGDRPGIQEEVEVPEDLPHHQQRLPGDRPRRPQVRRDLVGARASCAEHIEDAVAPATVLLEAAVDE
jgi:hypothetical protein